MYSFCTTFGYLFQHSLTNPTKGHHSLSHTKSRLRKAQSIRFTLDDFVSTGGNDPPTSAL